MNVLPAFVVALALVANPAAGQTETALTYLVPLSRAGEAVNGGFDISWHTIDGGGGTSAGGDFVLSGSIGQPDAGAVMIGGEFELAGGFWSAPREAGSPCPADVNLDGKVNIDDLFQILGAWGLCDDCPEDINDDGKVNIDDLFIILGDWGPCP
jgi:hypothetical protein